MRLPFHVLALLQAGLFLGTGEEISAAEPAKDPASLVKLLGHNSFKVREQAKRELIELGRAAVKALEEGLKSEDTEVRRSCAIILPIAMQRELEAKLAAFLADKEGKLKHDLPGWERYSKLVGNTDQTRQLFADMHRMQDGLLDPQDKDPNSQAQKFAGRAQYLQQLVYGGFDGVPQPVAAESIAKLLFVGSDPSLPINVNAHNQIFSLLYQDSFRQAMLDSQAGEIYRKLLVHYMMGRTDSSSVSQMLNLAMSYNFKEFVDVAANVALNAKGTVYNRGMAITVLARLGGREQIPTIRKLLDDRTEIGTYTTSFGNMRSVKVTTQVRDVALATLVRLSGQNLSDYGFDAFVSNPRLGVDPTQHYSPMYVGFSDSSKRDAAHKKWQEFEAGQKKP